MNRQRLKLSHAVAVGCLVFALIVGLSGCFLTNEPPIATFWFAPELPNTGEDVQFIGTNSIDPDAASGSGIETYEWNFGDGDIAVGEIVSHQYKAAGTYTVTLLVRDADGLEGMATDTITVSSAVPNPPIAQFEYAPSPPEVGESVVFNAEGSVDPTGASVTPKAITSYSWDFGDGTTGSGSIVSHAFGQSGVYAVVLTVRDETGANDTAQRTIVVVASGTSGSTPPVARFAISPTDPEEDETVTFSAETSYDPSAVSTKAIVVYHWEFGDESSATGKIVTHAFSDAGDYTVVLTVTDNSGLQDTEEMMLTVVVGVVVPPPPPPPPG